MSQSAQAILQFGQQVLEQQPFSRLLGAQLTHFTAEGEAELQLEIRPDLLQQHGFAHGGVLSYMADNALTFSGGVVLGGAVVTSEYKINYIRPGVGERLIARAYCLGKGRQQAVVRCDVFVLKNGEEKLCASAQGTIARLPEAAE